MKTLKRLLGIISCMLVTLMVSCTHEEPEGPIDGTVTDNNGPITLELTGHTATTAKFSGTVNLDKFSDLFSLYEEVGIIYSLREDLEISPLVTFAVPITTIDKNNRFEKTMSGLLHGVKYYYSSYVCANGIYKLGEVQSFTTDDVNVEISEPIVTSTTATFKGKVKIEDADLGVIDFGVAWKGNDDFDAGVKEISAELEADGSFTIVLKDLKMETEYYYASYVSQVGSEYGDIRKFTTSSADISASVSKITQTSVTFTGQASRNDADKDIEYGILCSTDENLKVGSSGSVHTALTEYFDANGAYTIKVDGLVNDTKYFYRWYARQGSDYKYGQVQDFTTSSVAVNLSVEPITQTTATFKGNYEQPDGEGFEIGVRYSTSSSDLTNDSAEKIVLSNKTFSHKISGLKYNTTYYYCYYVYQKGKYTYGSVQDFKTEDVHVEVSVSDITQTTVTFIGQTEITESSAIEVGILYSSNKSLSLSSASTKKKKLNSGSFSFTAEGLTNNTKYYYKYYIKQGEDYVYGERMDFMTTSISATLNQPTVTQTTATFSGKANFSDTDSIEFGILYSTSEYLSFNGSGVNKLNVNSLSGGEFSCKAEGLTYSTKYYYCYYAFQDGSYIYGKVDSFTTASVSVNLSVDAVTQTTAVFCGNIELTEEGLIEVGVLYSTGNKLTASASGVTKQVLAPDSSGAVSFKTESLQYNTTYYYCYYVCQNGKYTYGASQTFTTQSVTVNLSVDSITQTTAVFCGNIELTEEGVVEVGVLYSTGNNLTTGASGVTKQVLTPDSSGNLSFRTEGLQYSTTYNYCYYVCQNGKYTYGASQTFTTQSVTVNLSVDSITQTTAVFCGNIELTEEGVVEVGVLYSTSNNLIASASGVTKQVLVPEFSGRVSTLVESLRFTTQYYFCYYIYQNDKYTYGPLNTFTTTEPEIDLSKLGTANCYIVSQSGTYKFKAVQGNSDESVGNVSSVDVLWESFGTSVVPEVGDLVCYVAYLKDGYIGFTIPSKFKEGNAVVAAKDMSGEILWSWHLWLTDKPQENVYPNDAGIMMDRNLGAVSTEQGHVGALGLLYQWGRKDPFLGTSKIGWQETAKSTNTWDYYEWKSQEDMLMYTTVNPTTYIYVDLHSPAIPLDPDNWTTSDKEKSKYDPCPLGWRVPDGGKNGVWAKAWDGVYLGGCIDKDNKGFLFNITSPSTTWYPITGQRYSYSGGLVDCSDYASYWSASVSEEYNHQAYTLWIQRLQDSFDGRVRTISSSTGLSANPVRCIKE